MENIAKNVSDNVRLMRDRLNLTQSELAEKAGISLRGLQDIEYKRSKSPRVTTVYALAKVFGVSPDDLYRDPSAKPEPSQEKLDPRMELMKLVPYLEESDATIFLDLVRARIAGRSNDSKRGSG